MTLPVMTVATLACTPRWRSTKLRTTGPSFNRKNVANALNVRKKTSEVRPWIPSTTPCSNVLPVVEVPEVALSAVLELSTPASFAQLWILSTAWFKDDLISDDCSESPPTTRRKMITPNATNASSTMAAPAMRGIPRACIFVTRGPATVARIAPSTTGIVIVEVRARSHVRPTKRIATPTRNQASNPRSRTQTGAEKTRERALASIWTTEGPDVAATGSPCLREERSNPGIFMEACLRRAGAILLRQPRGRDE